MLPLPRGMLDSEDDDFLTRLIDRVINEIGILSGDKLTRLQRSVLCRPVETKPDFAANEEWPREPAEQRRDCALGYSRRWQPGPAQHAA